MQNKTQQTKPQQKQEAINTPNIIEYVGGPNDGETESFANLPSCNIRKPSFGPVRFRLGYEWINTNILLYYAIYRIDRETNKAHFVAREKFVPVP